MLSVVILTKNSAQFLPACLSSVKFADQIVVVDSGSTDQTIEIAKGANAKVVNYKPINVFNFSEARNLGLEAVSGEWVFYLDVDERVLEPLAEEIKAVIGEAKDGAWQVARRNIILGQEVHYPAFWPDYVIRLFKKASLKNWQGDVHEQPQFSGQLKTLTNPLVHLTHRDIDSMVLKSLDWANIDAKLRLDAKHPPMTGWRFLRIMLTETWHQGVVRRGFFNGTVGIIDALLQVFSLYLSYVKLWQLQQKPSLAEKYDQIDQQLIKSDFKNWQ